MEKSETNGETIINLMEEMDQKIRYHILIGSIQVEKVLDRLIASHFCTEDKELEFLETILGNRAFNFDFKRQIFEIILDKSKPEFKKKYKTQINWIPILSTNRNIIAHALIDVSEEAISEFKNNASIRYIRYEKGQKTYELFDLEKITRIAEIFNGIAKMIDDLGKSDE